MKWSKKNEVWRSNPGEKERLVLAREDKLVYSCLNLTPKSVSQLQEETGLSPTGLMSGLVHLTMNGLAQEIGKNYYIRS